MSSDAAYLTRFADISFTLLNAAGGEFAEIPQEYADYLFHEYATGEISLLSTLPDFNDTSYLEPWEIDEAIELLSRVNPDHWPSPEDIVSVSVEGVLKIGEDSESSGQLSFVEDNISTANNVEKVLKHSIESVFGDVIHSVRDRSGSFPSSHNNFLQVKDGTFEGTFIHDKHKFHFEIAPTEEGWICTYRLSEASLDGIPKVVKERKRDHKEFASHRKARTRGW